MAQARTPIPAGDVPRFFLYGEAARDVDDAFLHVETVAARSATVDWTIRPHAHSDLSHMLLIFGGSGRMHADGWRADFEGPCLLLAPAGSVHAFDFEPGVDGHVLTFADRLAAELSAREPAVGALFARPRVLAADEAVLAAHGVEPALRRLEQELVWGAPASSLGVEAALLTVLVGLLRAADGGAGEGAAAQPLVERYRLLLEQRFREGWSVADFASALAVSPRTLRAACAALGQGRSPSQMLADRVLIEAKRKLVYTNMTVAEVAYGLGFRDPAYFSRFFTTAAGCSPRDFRRRPKA